MNNHKLFQKFIAMAMSVVMILGMTPISAEAATAEYSYVDENGDTKTLEATVIDSTTTTLSSGWYVVDSDVSTTNLTVSGNVKLILVDGCTLTASATTNQAGVRVDLSDSLTIYGQTQGTGKLKATGNSRGAGIGGNGGIDGIDGYSAEMGGSGGSITIVGGTITANRIGGGDGGNGTGEYAGGGPGGNGGMVTITGGTLIVSGNIGGGNGGTSNYKHGGNGGNVGTVTITGGTVSATHIGGGNGGDSLYFEGIAGTGGDGGTVTITGGTVTVSNRIGGGDAGDTDYIGSPGARDGGNGSAVTISGGTVVVLDKIGGGNSSFDIDFGGPGSCVITGGSVMTSDMQPTPTNGSSNGGHTISLTTVALDGVSGTTAVTALFTGTAYTYGTKDMCTDASGSLYLWLPSGTSVTLARTKDNGYSGTVVASALGTLYEISADTEKPTVLSVTPTDGTTDLPISGNISITFSEMMDTSVKTVSLSTPDESAKTLTGGVWSYSGTVYTVSYSGLSLGKEYTIILSGFRDVAENVMEDDSSNSFTVVFPPTLTEYSYMDENRNTQTVEAREIDSETKTLSSGWYVVDSDVSTTNLSVSGNVKLILMDGCTLTANATIHNAGIKVIGSNSLTIYGQTQGTGKLLATGADRGAGIGGNGGSDGNEGSSGGVVTINGGIVIANRIGGGSGGNGAGFHMAGYPGGRGGTVTINGGTVTISEYFGGGNGGNGNLMYGGGDGGDGGTVTINSGTVTVSGKIGGGASGSGTSAFGLNGHPGGPGTCVITGGAGAVHSMQPIPTNGGSNGGNRVYRTIVALDNVSTATAVKALFTGTAYTYGTNDMISNTSGSLYLWLPLDATVTLAKTAVNGYSGEITANASGTLYEMPPDTQKPTAASVLPDNGSMDIPVSGNIAVTFSEMMDVSAGTVLLSTASESSTTLTSGMWSYSNTVYTVPYSSLSYSATYTITLSGFKDTADNEMEDDSSHSFSTSTPLVKSISVGSQSGTLTSGTAENVTFAVSTVNIESGQMITLNNTNSITGIALETAQTSGDSTTVTISTTAETLDGTHPLTLTIDGIISNSFDLVVSAAPSTESSEKDVTGVTSPGAATIDGTSILASVENSVTVQMISLSLSAEANWMLFRDAGCTDEIVDKTMTLVEGANTTYIQVTAEDGSIKIYTLTITRMSEAPTPPATGVIIGASITKKGGTLQLTANVKTADAVDVDVTWNIQSGNAYATISPDGLLTAVDNGIASVRATAQDGSGLYGEMQVTITGQSSGSTGDSTSDDRNPSPDDSGGDSGSSLFSSATIAPVKKPNQSVTATTIVTATAGANGTANATIPDKAVTDTIAKANTDAKARGKTANGIAVEMKVIMPKGAISLTTTLTQDSLQNLMNAGISSFELNGAPVSIVLDLKALQEIQKQSSGNITISFIPATGFSIETQAIIGNRPVYNVTISYAKNGKTVNITSLNNGTVTFAIPYTPIQNEAVGYLYGVYVDENGNISRIPDSAFDTNSSSLLFTTNHFSLYGIGYTDPSAKFVDIEKHWSKKSVDYVVGRRLLGGTSATTFSPDTAMSRGMLVTSLCRLAGADVSANKISSFTDVTSDKYYAPYIEWAYKKGIIQGIGNSQFAPDRAITREEIAVIITNYAKATGYTLPIIGETTIFVDNSNIASSYQAAVKAMQLAGIMMGGNGNRFIPKSCVTRAEVSVMLHRYINLTINPSTAQGWALNDDGQYLYYKDGKPVTGEQIIDGVKHFFYNTGALQTGWVNDTSGNWYFVSGNTRITGWWDIGANNNNKRYHFTKDGLMVAGKWLEIDGKWYYFNADGTLALSTKIDGYEVDENGVRTDK